MTSLPPPICVLPTWPLETFSRGGRSKCDKRSRTKFLSEPQNGCPAITGRCSDHKWTSDNQNNMQSRIVMPHLIYFCSFPALYSCKVEKKLTSDLFLFWCVVVWLWGERHINFVKQEMHVLEKHFQQKQAGGRWGLQYRNPGGIHTFGVETNIFQAPGFLPYAFRSCLQMITPKFGDANKRKFDWCAAPTVVGRHKGPKMRQIFDYLVFSSHNWKTHTDATPLETWQHLSIQNDLYRSTCALMWHCHKASLAMTSDHAKCHLIHVSKNFGQTLPPPKKNPAVSWPNSLGLQIWVPFHALKPVRITFFDFSILGGDQTPLNRPAVTMHTRFSTKFCFQMFSQTKSRRITWVGNSSWYQ